MLDTSVKAGLVRRLARHERLNFLLTNRIPRVLLTRAMARYSRIRNRPLTRLSIATWRLFTDLDLSDAKQARFRSLHECFTRELQPGARVVDADPGVCVSPCDAIVGACGTAERDQVFQAKGSPYSLRDLFGPNQDTTVFEGGTYVTLRLTSAMYHRFHAPHALDVDHVTYISGDVWNVNPVALKRIERLYCRNERVVIRGRLQEGGQALALVAVAAVLVASVRLHFLDVLLHLRWKGPNEMPCSAHLAKGQEMGWFEHGSTIIVFAPPGFELVDGIAPGTHLRMGQPLLQVPSTRRHETGPR